MNQKRTETVLMLPVILQSIALVSYGNHYLNTGKLEREFYPSNAVFSLSEVVNFRVHRKHWLTGKMKEEMVALEPKEWYEIMKKEGTERLAILHYSVPEADGTVLLEGNWPVVQDCGDHLFLWFPRWKATRPDAPDGRGWTVDYLREGPFTPLEAEPDPEAAYWRLQEQLQSAAAFAKEHGLDAWWQRFEDCQDMMRHPDPLPHFALPGLIVEEGYLLPALQLLWGALGAYSFGGVEDWDRVAFTDSGAVEKHREVCEGLYAAVTNAIVAAVNAYRSSRSWLQTV